MSRIVDMWRRGEVPEYSGLYRADDTVRAIEIDGAALSIFRVGEPFDVADLLAVDQYQGAEIDESARAQLPDGGEVFSGEGALGNEGFFARLDAKGELVWVVYLRNENPFYQIAVDGTRVTFTNNIGREVTVDLNDGCTRNTGPPPDIRKPDGNHRATSTTRWALAADLLLRMAAADRAQPLKAWTVVP